MLWRLVALASVLTACSACGKKQDEKPVDVDVGEVAAKLSDYVAWGAAATSARQGFLADECDDVLFTGLRGSFVATVDLQLAELAPGEWTRRRKEAGECYPAHSASRFSRDMALGVGWWADTNGKQRVARDLVDYLDRNDGRLGPGDATRTAVRPPLYGTLAKVAGLSRPESMVPVTVSGLEVGYERHVASWHLALRARLNGGLENGYHWWLRRQAEQQPGNALYQFFLARFVTGRYEPVVAALMREDHFPRGRLPTSQEHCAPWLWEHEEGGASWQPCKLESGEPDPVIRTWTGSEWAVVAKLLVDAAAEGE